MTIQEKAAAWTDCPVMTDELLQELRSMNDTEKSDSFYRNLVFGTGGLRGILGAGTNRMNIFTVIRATRGLGCYLKEHFDHPSCAVSYDSRIHSRDFAEMTAASLADMGIRVSVYPTLEPTPMLSFAVRHLKASAGVMITASHNPAAFNGYKVYGPDGCQITLDAARQIQEQINLQPDLADRIPDFDEGLRSGMIRYISGETVEAYYRAVLKLQIHPVTEPLHLVYSPLNGTGNIPVREIMKRLGNITVDSFAAGSYSVASGRFSTSLGLYSSAEGYSSFAAGSSSNAFGNASLAIGQGARAKGEHAMAIGNNARVDSAIVTYNEVLGGCRNCVETKELESWNSFAIGSSAQALGNGVME